MELIWPPKDRTGDPTEENVVLMDIATLLADVQKVIDMAEESGNPRVAMIALEKMRKMRDLCDMMCKRLTNERLDRKKRHTTIAARKSEMA